MKKSTYAPPLYVKFIMYPQFVDFDGREWFFTPNKSGGKMALNLKTLIVGFTLVGSVSSHAVTALDTPYYQIVKKEIRKINTEEVLNVETYKVLSTQNYAQDIPGLPNAAGQVDPIEKTGKIISVARDLVALGEDFYKLVVKGKPSNTTKYAPISVIPRIQGEDVDVLDTENWNVPKKYTYEIAYTNFYGVDTVKFRYSVIYSYGGSFNGKGAYLTAVQVIPERVNTLFGYDFTATMKLGGIQNQGTRENPIAAATILIEYTVSTILQARNEVNAFFITGKGGFKPL